MIFGPVLLVHADKRETELTPIHLPKDVPIIASTTYAGMTMGAIMTPEMRLDYDNMRKSLAMNGYIEKETTPPRTDYVLNRLDELRQFANVAGQADNADNLGFHPLEVIHARGYSELPFVPRFLPPSFREPGSEAFLIKASNHLTQFYTSTEFGALLIDELQNATISMGAENAEIGNQPALLVPVKHGQNKWATVVLSQQGNRVLIVESSQLLVGERRERFLQMVNALGK
jgi:hypothetical protein